LKKYLQNLDYFQFKIKFLAVSLTNEENIRVKTGHRCAVTGNRRGLSGIRIRLLRPPAAGLLAMTG